MMVDKLAFHLQLYRQHQRLCDAGIQLSRALLTQLTRRSVRLLEPIHYAQMASIRTSRVVAMDETPIKNGPTGTCKMKAAYFWPVYGQQDEICLSYYPIRCATHIQEALGLSLPQGTLLQTDGYAAYAQYAKQVGLKHVQCWSHARRKIFDAKDIEPGPAGQALEWISALVVAKAHIRQHHLTGAANQAWRITHAKPVVQRRFAWIDKHFEQQGFLPSSPLTGAPTYLRERRAGLEVYFDYPDVPIDTNHLERALRVIPMSRKNWLYNWNELGAKHIGIIQSLIVTCRLHDIDPYNYLVDVLQRVGQQPASKVHELTPRL
jgi:transposase